MSKIGYALGGSTRPISSAHWSHASVPQKSSTVMKPPFSRYARSASTSSSVKRAVPASSRCSIVQRDSSGSVSRTTT